MTVQLALPFRRERPRGPGTSHIGSAATSERLRETLAILILKIVDQNRHLQFMFLSKTPFAYIRPAISWPPNTIKGLTIVKKDNTFDHDMVNRMAYQGRIFLSIEPLLGPIYGTDKKTWDIYERFIIGAMTGPGAVVPKQEWIQSIRNSIPAGKIYWKPSIRKYL